MQTHFSGSDLLNTSGRPTGEPCATLGAALPLSVPCVSGRALPVCLHTQSVNPTAVANRAEIRCSARAKPRPNVCFSALWCTDAVSLSKEVQPAGTGDPMWSCLGVGVAAPSLALLHSLGCRFVVMRLVCEVLTVCRVWNQFFFFPAVKLLPCNYMLQPSGWANLSDFDI